MNMSLIKEAGLVFFIENMRVIFAITKYHQGPTGFKRRGLLKTAIGVLRKWALQTLKVVLVMGPNVQKKWLSPVMLFNELVEHSNSFFFISIPTAKHI